MTSLEILIADDHEPVRRGLRALIESRPDWKVCGEATDGKAAVEKAKELKPNIAILDVSMPVMNGLDAARLIREETPGCKILIVSQNDPVAMQKAAAEAGAGGFVPKSRLSQDLVGAIEALVKNGAALKPRRKKPQARANPSQVNNLITVRGTELLASDTRERYREKIARITLDSMVQFVGLLDAKGNVLEINHVALDAVGVKLAEVEGKPFWTTFWWQVSEEINATLREMIWRASQGEFVRWDTEIYGRAGGKETIIIDASLMPVKDERGDVVFITAEGRDITEKKANEREIARQREELAQLDKLKTQFFANISHEFRTPLTLMMGPLEDAIAQPDGLSAPDRERLELAHRNSLRLLKLVNTLLDFSRIEAGRIQAAYEPTDLALLTAELASVFRSAIERAGLRLIVDCPALPEMAYVDREMWEKIVLNLLSNAFKFTFEGEIEVSLRVAGSNVEMTVRDTGTGIPADELPRLFERFHRVKSARGRSYEGSGIGLALVQELAKLHGGSVRVESEVDRGSRFIVTIPLGKDHLPAERIGGFRTLASTGVGEKAYVQEALRWLPGVHDVTHDIPSALSASETLPHSVPEGQKRARILLADDNADMRDYVQRLLKDHYEVVAVGDGEAALKRAREQRPDLILTDVMMPRLDGFGVLHAVRAEESLKHVPVILLSARAGEESRIEGLHAGADDYLVKPFSARELLARVSSHLAMTRVRTEAADLERQLRLDAEMLAAIVASSDDAIISKNLDGVITTWNDGAQRIFGYSREEAIGQHITLIIPSDRQHEESEILRRVRSGQRVDHFQTVRARKDGSTLDISVTVSPLRDSTGAVVGASKVARDISKQKRAEQALRDSEERFRAIVETTPECVKLVAADGTLLHMNAPGLRMVGADCAEAVIGRSVFDLIAPEHRDRFRAFHERVCQGERGSLEFDIIGIEGQRRRMETHAAPLRNPDGSVSQLAITRDITERNRAEEALRESEERLRALVNASAYVVYRMSPDWKVMQRLDGKGFISDAGNPTEDWLHEIHPGDRPLVMQAIQQSLRTSSPFEVEYRVQRADGSVGWTLSRAVPRLDAKGEIIEWFGAASDVTRRKQAEEDYRKLAETLDAEVRARTREVEERNADVLRQSEQLRELSWRLLRTQDEERRYIARELHDSAGQTLTVLGMNLAQLVHKTGRKAPELVADAETIQETVQQLQREIRTASYLLHPPLLDESGISSALSWYTQGLTERSGLEIALDISEDFGRLPGDMELLVFRLVQECLTNIHRHSGSRTAKIKIVREGDLLTLNVQDHGKGMSPARLAEVHSQGSGVGIRGMRERLRQFRGTLNIESNGSGTRILVTIPIPKTSVPGDDGAIPLQASLQASGERNPGLSEF